MFRRKPELAPWPARALAATIDVLGSLGILAALLAVGYKALSHFKSNQEIAGQLTRPAQWLNKPQVKYSIEVVGLAVRISLRGRQSPGRRIARIRLVDARTGGPPTVWATVVTWALGEAIGQAVGRASRLLLRGRQAEREAASERLTALRNGENPDPVALRAAAAKVQTGCLPALMVAGFAWTARRLVALSSPRRQTIEQRLSGTLLVRDRS